MFDFEKFATTLAEAVRPVVREELSRIDSREEPLLTKKDLISRLGCSYKTFSLMERALSLPYHLVGRRPHYIESEVRERIKSSDINNKLVRNERHGI